MGLWCGVVLLALRLHHSTIQYLCISTMMARLSSGWYQEKTRHGTGNFMLMDNGNGAQYSYGCYGGTHLTTSTRFSGSGRGKISCTSNLESGISFLSSPQSLRLQKSHLVFNREFDVDFELKYRLTKLNREEWTRRPRIPLHLRGLSAIQKGPRPWGEPGPDSINNLRE
jgi:hypothetical protein